MRIKHNITLMQSLWAIASAILLITGIGTLTIPDDRLFEYAQKLGIAMFIAGAINLFVCIKNEEEIHGARWLLTDGLITTLLSLFPIFNNLIQPVLILFFFSVWELFSGVLKVVDSKELKEDKVEGWQYILLIGGIELFSGIGAMVEPIDAVIGINRVISIIFIVQSAGFIIKAFLYKNLTKLK